MGCIGPVDGHAMQVRAAGQTPSCVGARDCDSSLRGRGGGTPTGRAAQGAAGRRGCAACATPCRSRVARAPRRPRRRIGAQCNGRRARARGLLGVRHHRFEGIEGARKTSGQAVRQQAEGGVVFGAVPASDPNPARGLARVGAVARQRTSPVRGIRTPLKTCIAPRPGPNPTSPTQREFCRFSLFSTTQVIELLESCTPNSPQYRL